MLEINKNKTASIIPVLSICLFLFSCGKYQEESRSYSPDHTKYILRYYYIEVPWSPGSPLWHAILRSPQTIRSANKYALRTWRIDSISWMSNDTAIAEENFIELTRTG